MYLQHFSLNERPFTISPDPRFLFMSNRYREALAHLTYGVQEGGGFVLLTGEVGTGKTTVCRCLLQQLPENTRLAFVLNPKLNSMELLATICDELKIEYPENCTSLKILTDKLSEYLLKSYKDNLNVVVMIDEAQNLATEVLEQIRLLTNLETNQKKLLQIILVGQPELQEKLAQRDLRQLAQRITARYHLRPLSLKETIAYVLHRVRIAGCNNPLFSREAIEYLHEKTQGIPRLVNTISDRALFAAAARKRERVDQKIMKQAVKEVMGEPLDNSSNKLSKSDWFSASLAKASLLKPVGLTLLMLVMIGFAYMAGRQSPAENKAGSVSANSVNIEPVNSQSANSMITGMSTNIPVQSNSMGANLSEANSSQFELPAKANDAVTLKNNQNDNLLEQLIGDQRWDNNGHWSMQSLLALWQIDYSPLRDGDACVFAAGYGLKCNQYTGQWQQLRDFNRPVNIKLSAGLQGDFWGTLKSINGFEATLIFGDKESSISLDKLSTLWTGDFMLVWQEPPGFNSPIKLGDSGEAVNWLSRNLNYINLLDNSPSDLFDLKLQQSLINYQTLRNINADGIAGMQTIIKINTENLPGIPLLISLSQKDLVNNAQPNSTRLN